MSGKNLASNFWRGEYGIKFEERLSDKTYKKSICQEHAHLPGGLLRAIGVPVREMNVLECPFTFIGFTINLTDSDKASGKHWPNT